MKNRTYRFKSPPLASYTLLGSFCFGSPRVLIVHKSHIFFSIKIMETKEGFSVSVSLY